MSGENNQNLQTVLKAFLQKQQDGQLPEITARVLSVSPLRVSDNEKTFLEMTSFLNSDDASKTITPNRGYNIILKDWKFIFQRIPNTHEYYVDMEVSEYEMIELKKPSFINTQHMHSLIDEVEVKYLAEKMRRVQMESLLNIDTSMATPVKKSSKTSKIDPADLSTAHTVTKQPLTLDATQESNGR